MGDILHIHLKECKLPTTSVKSPLPEAIDFAENAKDPNEVMECISILDGHVRNAMNMLTESDDSAKALDMGMKEIHAAFDDLPAFWIRYCVTELLFRWHRERVEAIRQENDEKSGISSSPQGLRDNNAKLRVDSASLKDAIEAGRITTNGARQLMGLHPISSGDEDQLLARKGTRSVIPCAILTVSP